VGELVRVLADARPLAQRRPVVEKDTHERLVKGAAGVRRDGLAGRPVA
jgi:hypothetical protein